MTLHPYQLWLIRFPLFQMTAEPYICFRPYEIQWFFEMSVEGSRYWQLYADFERQKLRKLGDCRISIHPYSGYCITNSSGVHWSERYIGYTTSDFNADTESSRLLKRADFLKAVCEKEGVTWLPKAPHRCGIPKEFCGDCAAVQPEGDTDLCIECGIHPKCERCPCKCHREPDSKAKEPCQNCEGNHQYGIPCSCPCHKQEEPPREQCPKGEYSCCNNRHRMNGNNPAFCKCACHGRDYYTKAEIDERMQVVTDHLVGLWTAAEYLGEHPKRKVTFFAGMIGHMLRDWREEIAELRRRFLS